MTIHRGLLALQPQLLAYARAICGNADEADDLVQDAIVRALTAPQPPTRSDDLRPWMFRIMRNLHYDCWRKAKVRTEYSVQQKRLDQETPPDWNDPLSGILVRQTFEALSRDHREVLFLVDIMEMRYAEAADVLAVAEGTVMSRLSRARRAMLDRLEETNVTSLARHRRKIL